MKNMTKVLIAILCLIPLTSCNQGGSSTSEDASLEAEAIKRRPTTTTPPPTSSTPTATAAVRGIRLDPGYFYGSHPGKTPAAIATDIVTTVKAAGTTQLYLYAYNTVYGAYYPTTYAQTLVESGYGVQNIFGAVTAEAKKQGLSVIAVVPLNNFKKVWDNNPNWRVKKAGGVDYLPLTNIYLLSASVVEYQNWYKGFIDDLIAKNPTIDGVEAVEPTLDYFWDGVPDQNPSALAAFSTAYPGSAVGSSNWLNFRASEFLKLIALFNQQVHKNLKTSWLVQTWTAKSDGTLMSASSLKTSTGFDFVGVTTLQNESKTDNLVTELIWQQWYSQYGTTVFNPNWVATVGLSYINTLKAAGAVSNLHAHVEISTFTGSFNTTTPSLTEFQTTLQQAKTLGIGISVYDYNQIRTRSAFTALSNW